MRDPATIYLFDVDGTLIDSGGSGRRAIERALDRHYGRAEVVEGVSFAGRTDRAIFRALLEALGASGEASGALLDSYLEFLAEEVREAAGYVVHPGVEEVVDELRAQERAAVGLGTGNLEPGAHLKLARGGLAERFPFGGFGSDAEDRAALLRIGAERGAARLHRPLEACRVVVVGDTPLDVEAAHAIGAACAAVVTGHAERERLEAAGSDRVLDDLSGPGTIRMLEELVHGGAS